MIYKCLEYDSNQPAKQQSRRHIIRTGSPKEQHITLSHLETVYPVSKVRTPKESVFSFETHSGRLLAIWAFRPVLVKIHLASCSFCPLLSDPITSATWTWKGFWIEMPFVMMQIPAGALQSVMTKSRQEIPRKYESVSFFHKLLTRPAFPGCTPLLGVEMAVLVVRGRARTRKNKVLNTYYLSYQTSKFLYDRSLHLFFRRGQCSWLGNSNIEEHHLEKCEGAISSHVSIAPSLELARTSVPFILLLFEFKHAKLIPHSEPSDLLPLMCEIVSLKIFNQIPPHQPGLHIGRAFTGRLSQHPPFLCLLAIEFSVIHPSEDCAVCTSSGARLSGFEPGLLCLLTVGYRQGTWVHASALLLFSC